MFADGVINNVRSVRGTLIRVWVSAGNMTQRELETAQGGPYLSP